jgi:N-acetylmuramoyl-L-alanine amidase
VRELQRDLAAFGYGIDITGDYDSATRDTVAAFQRHFRPARIDGKADQSTLRTLAKVAEKQRERAGGDAVVREGAPVASS